MWALLAICVLFSSTAWAHEELGWHKTVGIKNAELIKQSEEAEIRSRIVGGTIAPVYAHPYLVGLVIDIVGSTSPSACGGSLLSTSRILTAAHCWNDGFSQAFQIQAVMGSPFLFHGGVRIYANGIAVHHRYDSRTWANDIAMLYLPRHVPLSGAIQPIRLPSGALLHMNYAKKMVRAAGYGRYSDLSLPTTNTMARNVLLEVIPLEKCRSFYGQIVQDSNICTNGYGGVGICQGDSGGPLTLNVHGEEVLIGVSSFVARDGCELEFPSAFARVSSYIDWIRVQI